MGLRVFTLLQLVELLHQQMQGFLSIWNADKNAQLLACSCHLCLEQALTQTALHTILADKSVTILGHEMHVITLMPCTTSRISSLITSLSTNRATSPRSPLSCCCSHGAKKLGKRWSRLCHGHPKHNDQGDESVMNHGLQDTRFSVRHMPTFWRQRLFDVAKHDPV
jgi:hypothetical protein